MNIRLRSVQPEDEGFLFDLYCSTRAEELSEWGWGESQQRAFLAMQYRAQTEHYASWYRDADHHIICSGDQLAGRLLVVRGEKDILLADISLLPQYRNAGIGTALIKELQSEAASARKPLRLHVTTSNPAVRLYERLGFSRTGHDGVYCAMEWAPPVSNGDDPRPSGARSG